MNFQRTHVIKEENNVNDFEYITSLINYLSVLQDGRTKPDTKGGGYIRESVYNIDEIEETKQKINDFFRIKGRKELDVKFKK